MQARWPLPNGFQALTGRAASASRLKFSGSNASGVRSPDAGIAMQRQHQHGDEGVLLQLVFAADGLVLQRRDAIGRRRRPQPQRFLQDLRDVGELGDLLIGRLGVEVGAEHAVDLLIGLLEHVGMLEQRIERARQQAAGGLVSGDQEGIDLVADVDVVELFAGRAVDAGHHGAEHVLFAFGGLGVLAALGDDLVDHLVHEGDIARRDCAGVSASTGLPAAGRGSS